jgi:hypothetical protein
VGDNGRFERDDRNRILKRVGDFFGKFHGLESGSLLVVRNSLLVVRGSL